MLSRRWMAALAGGVFLLALALYLLTLAPTITWRFSGSDSGELASAAYTWGVAHPTGYPLWTLLGFLVTRVPAGDPAARTGFLSALCGAGAASLVALTVLRLSGALKPAPAPLLRMIAGAAAGLALASAPAFWSQSILTETYSLNALLTAVIVWLVSAGVEPAPSGRTVSGAGAVSLATADAACGKFGRLQMKKQTNYLLAFGCGLALTNHSTAIFAVLAAAVAVGLRHRGERPAPRTLLVCLLLFLLPLALYLLLPLRAAQHPAENWNDPQTAGRFLRLITGAQYHYLLDWRHPLAALRSLPAIVRLFLGQFAWWGVPLAIYGLVLTAQVDTPFAVLSLLMLVSYSVFTAVYRAQGMERYLLPAYLIEAVLIGCGLAGIGEWLAGWAKRSELPRLLPPLLLLGVVTLSLAPFTAYHFSSLDLRHEYEAYDYAKSTLAAAAPDARILSNSDQETFSLWYLQKVEGVRRDVTVIDTRLGSASP